MIDDIIACASSSQIVDVEEDYRCLGLTDVFGFWANGKGPESAVMSPIFPVGNTSKVSSLEFEEAKRYVGRIGSRSNRPLFLFVRKAHGVCGSCTFDSDTCSKNPFTSNRRCPLFFDSSSFGQMCLKTYSPNLSMVLIVSWKRQHKAIRIRSQMGSPNIGKRKKLVCSTPVPLSNLLFATIGLYCYNCSGAGDLHTDKPRFNKHRQSVSFIDETEFTATSPQYILTLYPNEDFYTVYSTPNPWIASFGSAAIVLAMCLFFLLYDHFVVREVRTKQELLTAKRHFMRFVSHEVSEVILLHRLDKSNAEPHVAQPCHHARCGHRSTRCAWG